MSILKDLPSNFGYFQPENFDGSFVGPLTARDALIRSRNIPAVWLASQVKSPSLYGLLQRAGIKGLRGESHYGLALALGGGEMTPEELARLYLMLAGDGHLRPLRYLQEQPQASGPALLTPQAAFMVRDMLRRNPRPDGLPGRHWRTAWKTGTSWGFHDAWSAGLVGPYVLVVWVGNFDGRPNPAFIGAKTAAPLFFRIADALPLALPNVQIKPDKPPPGLIRIDVCAASGELPNRWCPQTRKTWYIPGVSPIRVSNLHRPVLIDTRTGKAACPPFDPQYTREEVFEFWPSDVQRLYRAAGLARRTPPTVMKNCQPNRIGDQSEAPHDPFAADPGELSIAPVPTAGKHCAECQRGQRRDDVVLVCRPDPDRPRPAAIHAELATGQVGEYRLRVSDDQGAVRAGGCGWSLCRERANAPDR